MSTQEFTEEDVIASLDEFISDVGGEPRLEVDVDGRRHTVEIRPVYEFERDIVDDLIEPRGDRTVTGAAIPIKGKWIYGWLNLKGEDYINSIWKNYQFFLKYVEGFTSDIENVGTVSRAPGTYNSMYRYLIILEELELLERHRRQPVPEEEYDFPVPEEFRTRTYIRLTSDFEGNEELWNNPYEGLYPGGEKPPDREVDEDGEEIPIEPGAFEPEEEPDEEEPEEEEEVPTGEGLGAFTPPDEDEEEQIEPEDIELPETGASIEDFPDKGGLISLVNASLPEALERTFEDAPLPTPEIQPQDFELAQIAVFGTWAVGEAIPGRDTLELIVSIDASQASRNPGFIPAGIQANLGDVMTENNPYEDIFPNYSAISVFNAAFQSTVNQVIRREQDELIYYDLIEEQFEEV